jgi:pectin lyase
MQTTTSTLGTFGALIARCAAVGVVGKAPGFAASVTGGGSAISQYPKDITELKSWLTDSTAIELLFSTKSSAPPFGIFNILNKCRYDFIGSEGTVTETGCRPISNKCPGKGGQDAINHAE